VARLKAERKALLASGPAYTVAHPAVRALDRALVLAERVVAQLQAQARPRPAANTAAATAVAMQL
jgi:hypothetical protein